MRTIKKVSLGIGIAVAAFFALVVMVTTAATPPSSQLSIQQTNSPQQNTSFSPMNGTIMIVNSEFSVPAGGYSIYKADIPSGVTNIRLVGSFTADGSGIAMEATEQPSGYVYYQTANDYGKSGLWPVNSQHVDVLIYNKDANHEIGGTIQLQFDNTADGQHAKHVNADVYITYIKYVSN